MISQTNLVLFQIIFSLPRINVFITFRLHLYLAKARSGYRMNHNSSLHFILCKPYMCNLNWKRSRFIIRTIKITTDIYKISKIILTPEENSEQEPLFNRIKTARHNVVLSIDILHVVHRDSPWIGAQPWQLSWLKRFRLLLKNNKINNSFTN